MTRIQENKNPPPQTSVHAQTSASQRRVIGLDMHPDLFTAAALQTSHGGCAGQARVQWIHERLQTAQLETWARKHLLKSDEVVLEASGNSFEVARRLQALGLKCSVLESEQASALSDKFCERDKTAAAKLARARLSGLATEVWQPEGICQEHRELFFAHRNAVKDSTRSRNRLRSYLSGLCIRLKPGTPLTDEATEKHILRLKPWSPLQQTVLADLFGQLRNAEERRRGLEKLMAREVASRPAWAQLWRLMGLRHRVAFGLMALVGDITRFATPKKLSAYLGLSPRRHQSGNDPQGREKGVGGGRKDLRALLLQSAQNALTQKASPLHKWGWKLTLRKNRNLAAVAVARKLAVSIWHLLNGHGTPLEEASEHLCAKLLKIATLIGKDALQKLGFRSRQAFVDKTIKDIQNIPKTSPLFT